MRRLHDTSSAVLVGAIVLLSSACAPRSARLGASDLAPEGCDGVRVLEVQNSLYGSVEILDRPPAFTGKGASLGLVGPGWHTLDIPQDRGHAFWARVVGQTPFASYGTTAPTVRMAVRCRPTASTE